MNTMDLGDHVHRLVKLAMDTGQASSIEAGEALLGTYRLEIGVGGAIADSATLQAALLTTVNAGRRCFLGGVYVRGRLNVPLLVPWGSCQTVADAVRQLRGRLADQIYSDMPYIAIGDAPIPDPCPEFAVRVTFNGWTVGVVALDDGEMLAEAQEFTPSGVLAGALAVSEAFQFVSGSNVAAGRRAVGLSLWRPEATADWRQSEAGPLLEYLPERLWLIGLGHLGQSYLWTLGLLPYHRPQDVQLVLQDFDTLVVANDSTSPLTTLEMAGRKKTRQMASWAEARGFRAVITERHFAANFTVSDSEPHVALCGVDNRFARASLEDVGFKRIIEAGLGRGPEYLSFRMHTFPGLQSASNLWGGAAAVEEVDHLTAQPAYQALAAQGLDQCGITLLVNRAVGSSFVGLAVSTLVVAEVLRMVLGEHQYEVIDGSLRALHHRDAIVRATALPAFNPGYTSAESTLLTRLMAS